VPASKDTVEPRRGSLNIRLKPEEQGLIDRAARHAAQDVLLDRAVFIASSEAYAAFLARLDEPPRPNDRLRRSMTLMVTLADIRAVIAPG